MTSSTDIEGFEKRLTNAVSQAFVVPNIAIGNSLGIFEMMGKFDSPKTSQEIADAGGFKERYIREWLCAMVSSEVIEYEPTCQKYYLPKERLPCLRNLKSGPLMLQVAMEGFRSVRECFHKDGPAGVPYSNYPSFEEFMDKSNRNNYTEESLRKLIKQVPGLCELMEKGTEVLEIGCGGGYVVQILAKLFPNTSFFAVDLSETAIEKAKMAAKEKGLSNIVFSVMDILEMPEDWCNKWSYIITNDVIHDLGKPAEGLKAIQKILKPGGLYSIWDVAAHSSLEKNRAFPGYHAMYTISLFYCMPFSLGSCENGAGLGACWGQELAEEMVQKAGFEILHINNKPEEGIMHIISTKK